MSDMSTGGPPGAEPSLGGGMGGLPRRLLGQRRRSNMTSAAQANLKFDISGLNEFKAAIKSLRTEIQGLRTDFAALSRSASSMSGSLKGAVPAGFGGVGGGGWGHSGGVKDGSSSFSNFGTSGSSAQGNGPTAMQQWAASKGGAVGTAAAVGSAIAPAVGGAVNNVVSRWQGLQQTGAAFDVYGSRMAVTTGIGSPQLAGQLSRVAPFYGSATDIGQALVQLASQGAVYGGRGVAGASGAAGAQSVQMLQNLMPGMSAQQGAGAFMGMQTNVAQQRMATAIFGQAARSINTSTGQMKSTADYYNGMFKAIQANRQGPQKGQPYTREEWSAMRAPGTPLNIQLSWMWTPEQIDEFFTYAEAQSISDPTGTRMFTASQQQLKQVRGQDKSLATAVQQTETKQAQSDLRGLSQNYGGMITQQEANQRMIALQTSINDHLKGIFSIMSHMPGSMQGGLGGLATNLLSGNWMGAAGTVINMLTGDYGYGDIGDNGLSQLNPDLRGRLSSMMAANPNLQINSGFRTANAQQRMWESGNPNIAPPGKSRHTRGQAADIGPRSQLGWLQANARRFGLDTGASKGEPWHVQVAGTLIGDVGTSETAMSSFSQSGAAIKAAIYSAIAQAQQSKAATGSTAAKSSGSSPGTDTKEPDNTPTSGVVSVDTTLKALYAAGFRGQDLISMAAIPSRESSYKTDTHNPNRSTGDDSYGLWQINILPKANGPLYDQLFPNHGTLPNGDPDGSLLYDPYNAAKMAFAMYQNNKDTLYPWGPYKGLSPTYNVPQSAIDAATKEANSLWPQGYGDYGYGGGGGGGLTSLNSSNNVTNHFHFPISVNGGGNVDVNTLVRQIATKLEPQMRRTQMTRR